MINKSFFAVIFCFLIAMPSMADHHNQNHPDPIEGDGEGYDGGYASFTRLEGYYSRYGTASEGGEFTVYGNGLTLSNDAYASSTSDLEGYSGSFQTFCLERNEYAGNANVWVSEAFVNGDPGSHAYKGGNDDEKNGNGDNLASETAYLYYQFATGDLDSYDYDAEDGGRDASAGQLQLAIWYLEDEINCIDKNSQAWAWVQEAISAVEDGLWSGIGNVRVLQMWTTDKCGNITYKQDFLYLVEAVPVPAAVLLGALGMAMAGIKLRKFA